jgi:hypothetical protein
MDDMHIFSFIYLLLIRAMIATSAAESFNTSVKAHVEMETQARGMRPRGDRNQSDESAPAVKSLFLCRILRQPHRVPASYPASLAHPAQRAFCCAYRRKVLVT